MRNYDTDAGNILEVIETKAENNLSWYEFILHEQKPFGEDIELLLRAKLIRPDYYIEKFVREY